MLIYNLQGGSYSMVTSLESRTNTNRFRMLDTDICSTIIGFSAAFIPE